MGRLSYTVQLPTESAYNWFVQYCRPQDAWVKYKTYPRSRLRKSELNHQLAVF